MTAVVTATSDTANSPPRIRLDVTGSPGSLITVTRLDPDGNSRPVRTAEAALLVSGAWTGYDYESPFDPTGQAQITYSVAPSDNSTPFTTTVQCLKVTQAWLLHPGVPSLSQPINGTTLGTVTTQSGATLHDVLGRSRPTPVSDGVRKAPTFQLILKTYSSDGAQPLFPSSDLFPGAALFPSGSLFPTGGPDTGASVTAIYDLLQDTAPLLLQLVYPYTTGTLYKWINVGQVTEDRRTLDFGDPRRIITMDCTEVDRPAGGVAAQRTWADVVAESATWHDVLAKYQTWHGLLTGILGQ